MWTLIQLALEIVLTNCAKSSYLTVVVGISGPWLNWLERRTVDPKLRFVSVCKQTINNCQIKTYDADRSAIVA